MRSSIRADVAMRRLVAQGVPLEKAQEAAAEILSRQRGSYRPRVARPAADPELFPVGQRSADVDRCFRLLSAISPQTQSWHSLHIPGEPYSKARPRFNGSSRRAYNSEKQQANTAALRVALRQFMENDGPMTENVAIVCLFYRSRAQRIDTDNMIKQVLDAANGICWLDDYQVTAVAGIAELDRNYPRTMIAIGTHDSTLRRSMNRDRACERCGKQFRLPFLDAKQRFCSQACSGVTRGEYLAVPIACGNCGKPFKRRTAGMSYCSNECRLAGLHGRRGRRKPSHCLDCGVELPGRARRCRSCWRKNAGRSGADIANETPIS